MKELWIWTELLAFDNTQPDFGVKEYLTSVGDTPTGISFLTGIDFVFQHVSPEIAEKTLSPQLCSRHGHSTNGKRQRQAWTNVQIRELVKELHRYGVKVVFNVFQKYLRNYFHHEFIGEYSREKRLDLLGSLKDGRLTRDVFFGKLKETISDYGFDGWHAADDIAAPWSSILFPTDCVIQQFVKKEENLPEFLKEDITLLDEESGDKLRREKLVWLMKNRWESWNAFLRKEWEAFWIQAVQTVHGLGKLLLVNSPNGKSVFGGLQYMNVDYRFLDQLGVDYLIAETTTTSARLIWNRPVLHEFCAIASELAAMMPHTKVLLMPAFRDVVESFDVLYHAPVMLERDMMLLGSQRLHKDGKPKDLAVGLFACLGDCVEPQEWALFRRFGRQALEFDTARTGEMVWLTDSGIFDRLQQEHHQYGTWSPSAQITVLKNARSIDISAIGTLEELPLCRQPVIIPNYHLLTPDQQKAVLASSLPLMLTGRNLRFMLPEDAEILAWQPWKEFSWECAFLHWERQKSGITELPQKGELPPFDDAKVFRLYREWYPHLEIPDSFWQAAADCLREKLGALPLQNETEGMQLFRQYGADGTERTLILSKENAYLNPEVAFPDVPDQPLHVISTSPRTPLKIRDQRLSAWDAVAIPVKVPPMGILAFERKC